ncbi:MAG: TonB-dependent receptor [Deltaproteobacteria bacterium]|nr:TonB-dependent receptor [Deltaproteobacteria bacterium]
MGESLTMQEIVVTGERVPSRYELTPSSISVITSTTMQNSPTLPDALSHAPDVTIPAYGWMGALSGISIRGADTSQSEIMLDGIRLNNVELSGFDLSTFPLSGISSIEVARGGMSSLYGESAMGGIVNIMPDVFPQKNTVDLKAMAGSFDSYHIDATAKVKSGGWTMLISPGYESSKGDYPYIDDNGISRIRQNNDYRGIWVLAGLGFSKDNNRAYFITHLYDSNKGVPGALGMPSPQAREYDSHGMYIMRYRYASEAVAVKASLSHVNEDSRYFDNVYVLESNPSKSNDTDNEAGATLILYRIPFNTLSIKLDGLSQQAVSSNIGSHIRDTESIGLEDRVKPLEWLAIVGDTAYQSISDIGDVATYGIGTALKPVSWMAVKMRVSTAFQAPSLDDLYWPNAAGAQGNPALKPETKTGYELGLLVSPLTNTTIEINGFYDRYHNLIQWSPSINNVWMPQNISGAIIKGIELSVNARPSHLLAVSGNMSALDTVNLSNSPPGSYGEALTYRPDIIVNTSAKIGEDNRYLSFGIGYTGGRYITPSNSQSLPGFYDINAMLSYKIGYVRPFITFTQYFSDSFNTLTSYQYVPGYPLPGRYVWAGIQCKI